MKKQKQEVDIEVKALFLKALFGANTATIKSIIKELKMIICVRRINKIRKFFKNLKRLLKKGGKH